MCDIASDQQRAVKRGIFGKTAASNNRSKHHIEVQNVACSIIRIFAECAVSDRRFSHFSKNDTFTLTMIVGKVATSNINTFYPFEVQYLTNRGIADCSVCHCQVCSAVNLKQVILHTQHIVVEDTPCENDFDCLRY